MRNREAFKNMITNIFLQIVVAISGIILPRFFIECYGSSVNGMITSLTQFLSYIGLVEAGIGSASIVALYKPLAENDYKMTSQVLSATKRFYRKAGWVYLALTLVLAVAYPLIVGEQVEQELVIWMVLVLSSSTVIDFFVLGKYRVLLTADQKNYIIAFAQIVGNIVALVVSILFIQMNMHVLIVKGVTAVVFILRVVIIYLYVRRKYSYIDYDDIPAYDKLNQRWDALLHQIVGTIVLNTGIVILTLFSGNNSLTEVSVYTTYNMVGQALYMFLNSFSTALSAGFGNVIASKNTDTLKRAYSEYEYMYIIVLHLMYICMAVLILPFIYLYTINIEDANYVRPAVAFLFVISGYIQNIRLPSLTMIIAAGHFKETRYRAIIEGAINIVLCMIFVFKLGIVGVLLGTICSFAYRSIDCVVYTSKYIVEDTHKRFFKRIIVNLTVSVVLIVVALQIVETQMSSFFTWVLVAGAIAVISAIVLCFVNYIMEPKEFKNVFNRIRSMIK